MFLVNLYSFPALLIFSSEVMLFSQYISSLIKNAYHNTATKSYFNIFAREKREI